MENEIKENEKEQITVCVDFDGEKRQLDLESAAELCRQAFEFGAAKENYKRLSDFAKADNISVPQFLDDLAKARAEKRKTELVEKCGGNEEMALHIMELEGRALKINGEEEFKKYFPNTDISNLPESVKLSAEQNNRSLLDEYLRFKALLELEAKKEAIKRKENEISSAGSLKNTRGVSFESAEFLKGVWR